MFVGLHIEMAAYWSAGTILQDSGWSSALSEAGVASPGTAESLLVASSVTQQGKCIKLQRKSTQIDESSAQPLLQ